MVDGRVAGVVDGVVGGQVRGRGIVVSWCRGWLFHSYVNSYSYSFALHSAQLLQSLSTWVLFAASPKMHVSCVGITAAC